MTLRCVLFMVLSFSIINLACKREDRQGPSPPANTGDEGTDYTMLFGDTNQRPLVQCDASIDATYDDTVLLMNLTLTNRGVDTVAFLPTFMTVRFMLSGEDFLFFGSWALSINLAVDTANKYLLGDGWIEPPRYYQVKSAKPEFIIVPPRGEVVVVYRYQLTRDNEDMYRQTLDLFLTSDGHLPLWSSRSTSSWLLISDHCMRRSHSSRRYIMLYDRAYQWVQEGTPDQGRILTLPQYELLCSTVSDNVGRVRTKSVIDRRLRRSRR